MFFSVHVKNLLRHRSINKTILGKTKLAGIILYLEKKRDNNYLIRAFKHKFSRPSLPGQLEVYRIFFKKKKNKIKYKCNILFRLIMNFFFFKVSWSCCLNTKKHAFETYKPLHWSIWVHKLLACALNHQQFARRCFGIYCVGAIIFMLESKNQFK